MNEMTERELLEFSARAAGYGFTPIDQIPKNMREYSGFDFKNLVIYDKQSGYLISQRWNPITDDGDALRLAAKLKLDIQFHSHSVVSYIDHKPQCERTYDDDSCAATRRAIVSAAAKIGKNILVALAV